MGTNFWFKQGSPLCIQNNDLTLPPIKGIEMALVDQKKIFFVPKNSFFDAE